LETEQHPLSSKRDKFNGAMFNQLSLEIEYFSHNLRALEFFPIPPTAITHSPV